MSDMAQQLARLQAVVESGQREQHRRFDGMDVRLDKQDRKLESIEREVKQTNGRVTRHDEQIKSIARAASPDPVTFTTVKTYGAFGGWLVAGLLGLLKLMGKL